VSTTLLEPHSRLRAIIFRTDTSATKFSLAVYGLITMYGIVVSQGICDLRVCYELPIYEYWPLWAVAWGGYSFCKLWRLWKAPVKPRPRAAWFINFWGVCMFGFWVAMLLYARWPNWFAMAGDLTLGAAALWVFVRTARGPGPRWSDSE
jgi:hypothetical protein